MRCGETGAIEFYGGESRSRFRFDFQRAQQGPGSEQQIVTVFTVMKVSENQKGSSSTPFFSTDNESSTDDEGLESLTELILWTGHRSPPASKVENLKES